MAGDMTEWTVATLHEHFDERIGQLERDMNRRFDKLDQTLAKAEAVRDTQIAEAQRTIESRLQGLNELRREVTEDRGAFVRRDVLDARLDALEQQLDDKGAATSRRINALEAWRNRSIGVITVLGLGSGALGVLLGWVLNQ